ncbi:MAG: 7-cyano-7-deazaguanine synthase QueC [Pseudomonadota bacterium]
MTQTIDTPTALQPQDSSRPQPGGAERKAIVLLSGGLDSATVLAMARAEGYAVYALSFDYGQRHSVELAASVAVAEQLGVVAHKVIRLDLRAIGGSALTDEIDVPKHRSDAELETGIPITYVPARNTVFLSYALAWAEVLETGDLFIGVNALDYSGYPDCRPEYIAAFETMANLATRGGVEGTRPVTIQAPLQHLTKSQIIERGFALGVDYALTTSCYDPAPDGAPCGACDSCVLRARGFAQVGAEDPLLRRFAVG